MPDSVKEVLNPPFFICKICWKKSKDVKFHITVQDCDMGNWSDSGSGFSMCEECFGGIMAFIDTKSGEILENMINSISKYENAWKGGHILHSIIERRINELTNLKGKLEEAIHDRGNQGKGGEENE